MAQCKGKSRAVPGSGTFRCSSAIPSKIRGATNLGCLLTLVIGVLLGYMLVKVIKVEQRFVQMRSAVQQEAVEAKDQTDERVILNVQKKARDLGLPSRAQGVYLNRGSDSIYVTVRWSDTLSFWRYDWVRKRVVEARARIW